MSLHSCARYNRLRGDDTPATPQPERPPDRKREGGFPGKMTATYGRDLPHCFHAVSAGQYRLRMCEIDPKT